MRVGRQGVDEPLRTALHDSDDVRVVETFETDPRHNITSVVLDHDRGTPAVEQLDTPDHQRREDSHQQHARATSWQSAMQDNASVFRLRMAHATSTTTRTRLRTFPPR